MPCWASLHLKEKCFLACHQNCSKQCNCKNRRHGFQFFTENKSDDYSLTIWLPKQKAVMNNFYWPGIPNLYSLRGAEFRDPVEWRNGLPVIRDLKPEIMMNTHARSVKGGKEVFESISNYMDLVTLVYDQTLRDICMALALMSCAISYIDPSTWPSSRTMHRPMVRSPGSRQPILSPIGLVRQKSIPNCTSYTRWKKRSGQLR